MRETFSGQVCGLHHTALAEVQMKPLPSNGDAHASFADINFYTGEKCKLSMKANGHRILLSNDRLPPLRESVRIR